MDQNFSHTTGNTARHDSLKVPLIRTPEPHLYWPHNILGNFANCPHQTPYKPTTYSTWTSPSLPTWQTIVSTSPPLAPQRLPVPSASMKDKPPNFTPPPMSSPTGPTTRTRSAALVSTSPLARRRLPAPSASMKDKPPNHAPPPVPSPTGPTTRARSVALKDVGRLRTQSRQKNPNPKPQDLRRETSPTEKPASTPYDAITKVGPPRGQPRDKRPGMSTASRASNNATSSSVTLKSTSDSISANKQLNVQAPVELDGPRAVAAVSQKVQQALPPMKVPQQKGNDHGDPLSALTAIPISHQSNNDLSNHPPSHSHRDRKLPSSSLALHHSKPPSGGQNNDDRLSACPPAPHHAAPPSVNHVSDTSPVTAENRNDNSVRNTRGALLPPDSTGDSDGLHDGRSTAARWREMIKAQGDRRRNKLPDIEEMSATFKGTNQADDGPMVNHRSGSSSDERDEGELYGGDDDENWRGIPKVGLQDEEDDVTNEKFYFGAEEDNGSQGDDGNHPSLLYSPQPLKKHLRDSPVESDPSDSDWAETRNKKLATRERRRTRGRDVSDTSLEDGEAEEEMMANITSEFRSRVGKSARKPTKRYTAKQKGKQKAPVASSREEDNIDEEVDANHSTSADGGKRCIPGPLSGEALKEIRKLGERTIRDADALAAKYRKSTRTIMVAAGLGVQHSRHGQNFANKFKVWYSQKKNPIRKGMSFLTYANEIHEAYKEFQTNNPESDAEGYEKACKPIHDYCNTLENQVDFDESKKNLVGRMTSIKEKFTNLAGAYWSMDEILIFGAVLHLGNDVAASHAGSFFAGADLIKDVVDDSGTDMVQFLDQLTTACKTVRLNKQGGLFKLPTLIDPIFSTTNGNRDRDRKIVGNFLVERIKTLVEHKNSHFPWEGWCDFAYKNHLVIDGWDPMIQAPGPDFSLKGQGGMTTSQWQSLVKRIDWKQNPFCDHSLPKLEIKRWEGGEDEDDARTLDEISNIALVTDGRKKALRTVRDSKLFLQERAKKQPKASHRVQQKSVAEDLDEESSPAPRSVASKRKKHRQKPSQDVSSSDDQRSASPSAKGQSDAEEKRPKVPLPSRARSKKHKSKRQRTIQSSEVEDEHIPVPPSSAPPHSRSMQSDMVTGSSRLFTHPTITHDKPRTVPSSTRGHLGHATLVSPHFANSAVPGSSGTHAFSRDVTRSPNSQLRMSTANAVPSSSRPSPHLANPRMLVNPTSRQHLPRNLPHVPSMASGVPSSSRIYQASQGAHGYPRQRQGLPPVTEEAGVNMRQRPFRHTPNHAFMSNQQLPPSEPPLTSRVPFAHHRHSAMVAQQPQSGHYGVMYDEPQDVSGVEYGLYADYDDGQMVWDSNTAYGGEANYPITDGYA